MNQIYFDNGSTSWPKAPGVPEAMADLLAHGAFNINRGNYEGAYEIEGVVLDTREQLTRLFHVKNSKGVVFYTECDLFPQSVYKRLFEARRSCDRDGAGA